MTRYTYTAYGLNFESTFPLPELRSATFDQPDIKIGYDEVPVSLPMPSANGIAWQSAPGRMLLTVDEIARYLIIENHEIRIQAFAGSTEEDVRIFLLGSVLGALLHTRQMLVLHSSVIQTERGAVLFMGRCGAGKSTLLGAFLQRGYAMLADDKAGIILNEDGTPQVMPGFPFIRLTPDSVKELGYEVKKEKPRHSLEKYVLPVERFCETPLPIHAAYSLIAYNKTEIQLEPLQTLDQFNVLNNQTYRRRFINQPQQRESHFKILGAVSNHAKVKSIKRPDSPCLIDELVERIEEDLAQ